ncbi:MAG: ATP-binding protein [bacterium]
MNYTFAVISFINTILAGICAFFVLSKNPRQLLNRLFFACALAVAFFDLATALSITGATPFISLIYNNFSNLFWLMFIVFMIHFSVVYSESDTPRIKYLFLPLVYVSALIFSLLSFRSNWFYLVPEMSHWGHVAKFGPAYLQYSLYSAALALTALFFLFLGYRNKKNYREKQQGFTILAGMIGVFLLGFTSDVTLPLFGFYLQSLVPLASSIFVLIFTYAMVRHGLLTVTPSFLAEDVLSVMPDIVVFTDLGHKIVWVNNSFCGTLGYARENIIGKACEIFHDNKQEHAKLHLDVEKQGKISLAKVSLVLKDGQKVPASLEAIIVKDRYGDAVGSLFIYHITTREQELTFQREKTIAELTKNKQRMLSILEDTTTARDEAKQKAVELAKALEGLKELDRLKTDFIATVSHELRTPLTTIKEGINLIADKILGPVNEKQEKMLASIRANISRLTRMIMELLDISRIEAGKIALKKEPFDLTAAAAQIVAELKPQAEEKQLELRVNFPPQAVNIIGDKDKVIQILVNLVANALKFTPAGFVEVSIVERENEVECAVADSGVGISKENMPKLFQKFIQFDRTPGMGEKGTGLGLAIVKGLVNVHHGKVRVESELGKGTRVIFTLPK